MRSKLILATRGSPLALAQANLVKGEIGRHHPGVTVEIMKIKTSGDQILDRPLRTVGGKGLFVKEIEEALLAGAADFAVHSMKDVPSEIPQGLKIGVILKREDPADVLLSKKYKTLDELPSGAIIGTSSLRRKLQLERLRPDLKIHDLRGNVDTRIKKMNEGFYDAIILALAGLMRLGRGSEANGKLPFIAAPGQGAIGLEYRDDDTDLERLLKILHDDGTALAVNAERVILKHLEGGCELPVGAEANIEGGKMRLRAFLANPTGTPFLEGEVEGIPEEATALGERLTENLMKRGASRILEEIRKIKKT
jgi:hydroxymethylbilane synthase